jgi:hypothetical protein
MSNNIYDILKKMNDLEAPKQTLTEGKKAKPDYIDIDKDGDKTEPMKKAAKEKRKGAVAEAVARVEKKLAEKYLNHKKKLGEESDMIRKVIPVGVIDGPGGYDEAQKRIKDYEDGKINKRGEPLPPIEDRSKPAEKPKTNVGRKEVDESGLQAYLGKKKYGEQGMQALQKAGREGASKEKMAMLRAKHDKMDEGEYNEDMLSPKQQKIARMAGDPKKIDANDLKALRAGKKKNAEGNAFSGALDAARDAGHSEFEVDGKTYKVKEGWDEMLKAQKERSGPQPSGGSGIKAGKRYGGSAQTDEPDTDNETGEVAKKGRGRPKKDKFAR